MAPKFGVYKFRNAEPVVPARDGWFRSGFSTLSSDAPTNTSQFSSVVKTNRQGVLTLTPGGDASVRLYSATGADASAHWTGKLGGAVSDWDVSRLEDNGMLVASTNGTVTYYTVDGVTAPTQRYAFQVGSKPLNVALHPTTAGVSLVTATSPVVSIYDVSASAPALTLNTAGDAPLWSAAWSSDGRLVGGVTKKEQAVVWDARAGSAPVHAKDVGMQPLKPARVAFVGTDLFVSSFSRTRMRQYALFSSSLETIVSQSVDTEQAPLVPLVDDERRVVYALGRGDMRLRQIEFVGQQSQEVTHALPSQASSGGLALAHWSTLPVMEAHIAHVLVPTIDKEGDTLLPLTIKVPRRQLIDYHSELFPDVTGSVPEQSAAEWLQGGDKRPLPVSLDPSRREAWLKAVEEGRQKIAAAAGVESAPAPAPAPAAAPPQPPAAVATPAAPAAPAPAPVENTVAKAAEPEPATTAPPAAATAIATGTATAAAVAVAATTAPTASTTTPSSTSLPPLEYGETYSSTSYKARNVGERILEYRKTHLSSGSKGPLMVGLQGPQGCGKTTLCDALLDWLRAKGLRVAVLSLDDTYRTHSALKKVATDHPNNPLLSGRGPPGTHDVELATSVLDAVTSINKTNGHVDLPTFDKSLCNGEGDRSQKTIPVDGPLDVFLFEGWSVGFAPITPAELEKRYAAKDGKYFPQHSLASLAELNGYLASFAAAIYPYFSVLVQIEPTSYEHVFTWRLQQEHAMKTANGGRGMTDDEVDRFVKRYMPAYELWAGGVLNADVPWAGKVLRLEFGKDREVLAVTTPAARNVKTPKPEEVKTSKVETAKAESASTPVPAAASVAAATAPASVAAVETKSAAPAPVPTPAAASAATLTAASAAPVATPAAPAVTPSTTPSTRYNPGWSRKYLSGKSPLNPTYDQVPAVLTLHQDSVILRTTPHLALFPIQGPGGRICVHPLAKKGRIPVGGVGYLSGGVGVADFAADPFGSNVVLAGDDGVLRVWNVGPEGIEGPGPEPDKVVRGQNVDKIVQIAFHPTAKNLLVAATNEAGKASLRFFDIEAGTEAKQVALDVKGIAGMAIAPAGDRIAISTKDGRVGVLDPRDPSTLVTGDGHSSPRSCQLMWVDDTHILSIGFARGSMRQINLYTVGTSITTEASQSISVSPAVLFPSYDADTNILYVWGKGDQSIQAFEIHPGKPEAIAKLPAFTGPGAQHAVAFFPKQHVDPRKVEVAKCLRLTARSIEEVSFTIPRSKTTFFQDDIYVPTIDTLMHTTTASAWLAGDKTTPRVLDLKPDGMELLSSAPVTTTVRTKFVPAAKVMSEEDRRKKEMDDLFQRAKAGFSSDEDDEPPRSGLPPPDDDW